MLISITRLRVARLRHLIQFMSLSGGSIRQATADAACLAGATYMGPGLTFWTATVWSTSEAMRAYVQTGAHRETLPWLNKFCSEAATAHFDCSDASLPSREEMLTRLTSNPRFIGVLKPTTSQKAKQLPQKAPWLMQVFKRDP